MKQACMHVLVLKCGNSSQWGYCVIRNIFNLEVADDSIGTCTVCQDIAANWAIWLYQSLLHKKENKKNTVLHHNYEDKGRVYMECSQYTLEQVKSCRRSFQYFCDIHTIMHTRSSILKSLPDAFQEEAYECVMLLVQQWTSHVCVRTVQQI